MSGGPVETWEDIFLETLNDTSLIAAACKAAGVSRTYITKQIKENPLFAERFTDIIEHKTDILEQIAIRRAAEGSDSLMMFMLKARRPHVYRENIAIQHNVQVGGQIEHILGHRQPIELQASKRREAARLLLSGEQPQQQDQDVIESNGKPA